MIDNFAMGLLFFIIGILSSGIVLFVIHLCLDWFVNRKLKKTIQELSDLTNTVEYRSDYQRRKISSMDDELKLLKKQLNHFRDELESQKIAPVFKTKENVLQNFL